MTLEQYRQTQNMTRSEAARALSVTESTYYRWETGGALPRRQRLEQIKNWSRGKISADSFL